MTPDDAAEPWDAFLSHHGDDKPRVNEIARWLADEAKLRVWLDEWNLAAGDYWQEKIGKALAESKSCVVFLGPHGLGPWQNREVRVALSKEVEGKGFRVVPLLLPGAEKSEIPEFLKQYTWVELEGWPDEDALRKLARGIRGADRGGETEVAAPEVACPYLGLRFFSEESKDYFCGRDRVVDELLELLGRRGSLALLGPSGSGKSSVVRAGLVPELGDKKTLIAIFTPKARPEEQLARALRGLYRGIGTTAELRQRLEEREELRLIALDLLQDAGAERLCLVIDQFEELFTQTEREEERQRFLAAVLGALEERGALSLVLAMRSDFLDHCAPYRDLSSFVSRNLFLLGPMGRDELRRAIEDPASKVGLAFQEGLVERILDDVEGVPGELPLLAHALLELYKSRDGRWLTHQAYTEIGGIEGALENRAESELLGGDGQGAAAEAEERTETLRKMFRCLVQPISGEGPAYVSRRATRDELLGVGEARTVEDLLEQWTRARLLTSGRDEEGGQGRVEVAHEALIRCWDRLRGWLEADWEFLRWRRLRLAERVSAWKENPRDREMLLGGTLLAEAEDWRRKYGDALDEEELTFVEASLKDRDRQRWWKAARICAGVVVAILLAAGGWSIASKERQLADNERQSRLLATAHRHAARAELLASGKGEELTAGAWLAADAVRRFLELGKSLPEADLTLRRALARLPAPVSPQLPHGDRVLSAAISEDGRHVATVEGGGVARLWEVASRRKFRLGREPPGTAGSGGGGERLPVRAVALSPQSQVQVLATAGEDGTAVLWDGETRREIRTLPHGSPVVALAFSGDGKRVATADKGGTTRVWSVTDGAPVRQAPIEHGGEIHAVALDFEGAHLATAGRDGVARVWEVASGREKSSVSHGPETEVLDVAFGQLEGELLLATASLDRTAGLWNALNGNSRRRLRHEDRVNGVAFGAEGRHLATASHDRTARVWQTSDGRELMRVVHQDVVYDVAVSGDGEALVTVSFDKTARVWAMPGSRRTEPLRHDREVTAVAFSPDGGTLATAGRDRAVHLWQAPAELRTPAGAGWRETRTLAHPMAEQRTAVRAIAFGPDGRYLAAGDEGGKVLLFDLGSSVDRPDGEAPDDPAVLQPRHDGPVVAVALMPDSRIVTASGKEAWLWSPERERLEPPLSHGGNVTGIAVGSEGEILATTSEDRKLRLWNAVTRDLIDDTSPDPATPLRAAAFAAGHDPRRLAVAGDDGKIRLWRITGEPKAERCRLEREGEPIDAHAGVVWTLAFSSDGTYLASGGADHLARVWDIDSAEEAARVSHDDVVSAVAFSPDGRYLATGSRDDTARLWHLRSRDLIREVCLRQLYRPSEEEWRRHVVDEAPDVAELCQAARPQPTRPGRVGGRTWITTLPTRSR